MADEWTDDELAAAVDAYREMQAFEAAHKPYNKRQVYRDLAEQFGRTEKAFEYRMQNISSVLHELGQEWISGLKPADNVGANVKPRIVALLEGEGGLQRQAAYKVKLPAIRRWLIEVARLRQTVTLGDLVNAFGIGRQGASFARAALMKQSAELGEPYLGALIVHQQTGRNKEVVYWGPKDDQAERERVYEYWKDRIPPWQVEDASEPIEIKAARFVSVEARPDQAAFRRLVFLAFQGRCAVSGCDIVCALDAAHVHGRNWRQGHNRAEDGYLLRKDLHALYDGELLRISEHGLIELDTSVLEQYGQFAGRMLASRS